MYTCNGKPMKHLRYRAWIDDPAALNNMWEDYGRNCYNYEIILKTPKEIKDTIKTKYVTLQPNQTLYFGKTSEFPRFKLTDSGFKRCIKIDKADVVVVGTIDIDVCSFDAVFEDEINVYVIDSWKVHNARSNNSSKLSQWNNNYEKYIIDNNMFYGTEFKKIRGNQDCSCVNTTKSDDVIKILNGTYTKLVRDKDVDELVNKNLDTMTADDVKSICDMLDSPDSTTRGVGLKMLCGYNIRETVLTVRTILGTRPNLSSNTEWKSVGVQQVLSTIKWQGFGSFPLSMWNILQPGDKTQTYTEYDKSLVKEVYIIAAKQYINTAIQRLRESKLLETFGVDISYEIK